MFLRSVILLYFLCHCEALPTPRVASWCSTSREELGGCKILSAAISSWPANFTMNLTCTDGKNASHCMQMIYLHQTDLAVLNAHDISQTGNIYNLSAILNLDHGEGTERNYYVLAVVKKKSKLTLRTLKGARSCHNDINTAAGWTVPIGYLLRHGILNWDEHCDLYTKVSRFFSKSCIPGILSGSHDNPKESPSNLCTLCKNKTLCHHVHQSQDAGARNALHCLTDGGGDVAFVRHIDVFRDAGKYGISNPNEFKILCDDEQHKGIGAFESCHLAKIPTPVIITRAMTKPAERKVKIKEENVSIASGYSEALAFKDFLLKLQETLSSNSRLSPSFLLFRDSTIRLVQAQNTSSWNPWKGDEFLNITTALRECRKTVESPNLGSKISPSNLIFVFLIVNIAL